MNRRNDLAKEQTQLPLLMQDQNVKPGKYFMHKPKDIYQEFGTIPGIDDNKFITPIINLFIKNLCCDNLIADIPDANFMPAPFKKKSVPLLRARGRWKHIPIRQRIPWRILLKKSHALLISLADNF